MEMSELLRKLEDLFDKKIGLEEMKSKVKHLEDGYCKFGSSSNHEWVPKFVNKFFHEVIPIYTLSNYLTNVEYISIFSDEAQSKCAGDGMLYFNNDLQKNIECTGLINGKHYELELAHLRKYKYSPVGAQVKTNNKNKNTDKREVYKSSPIGKSEDSSKDKFKEDIDKAIKKKCKNKYDEFWLIVSFNITDYPFCTNISDLSKLINEVGIEKKMFDKICFCEIQNREIVHCVN